MVFSTPEFIKAQPVEVGCEVKVALKLQNRVLADRVVWRQKGAEFQTVGSTTGVGLLSHEPTVGRDTRIADSSPIERADFSGFRLTCQSRNGDVAQLAERYLCKVDVRGSIPLVSTRCFASMLMLGRYKLLV